MLILEFAWGCDDDRGIGRRSAQTARLGIRFSRGRPFPPGSLGRISDVDDTCFGSLMGFGYIEDEPEAP